MPDGIYSKINARLVINASGSLTLWGGSRLSEKITGAMNEANRHFIEMEELLEKSGEYVAKLLGVEAAYISSGCFASLALSAAACMTGRNPDRISRLPDTTGIRYKILIQKRQRHSYDRALTVPGSILVDVGDEDGCSMDQMDNAIGPDTAAITYNLKSRLTYPFLSLQDTMEVARRHEIPVIVDAAQQIFPVDYFLQNALTGDLVCFGAKYFGAPQSTGFVCGKRHLIEAVADHGFIAFYKPGFRSFGRGYKVDRHEVIGLCVALEEWLNTDHEAGFSRLKNKLTIIKDELKKNPVVLSTEFVPVKNYTRLSLHIRFDIPRIRKTAAQLAEELKEGDPRILLRAKQEDSLIIFAVNLGEGEERIIIDRITESCRQS